MSTERFLHRHLGPRTPDVAHMLQALGVESTDALLDEVIPQAIRLGRDLALPEALTERQALETLSAMAGKNQLWRSYLGMGYHDTLTPSVILRNVLENPGWYTAYTPYQAEIAQGRLEALLTFQTMVQDLTGMEISNSSLLDEATAAAEAMTMAHRISRGKRGDRFFAAADCHPQLLRVLHTRAAPLGIEVLVGDPARFSFEETPVYGALLQYPATDGRIFDHQGFCDRAHAAGAMVVVSADLLSLTLLRPPGEFGADIVIGSSQRFGVPLGYGGPHAAFLATHDAHKRQVPGRIIGVSVDADGNRALRMALQTREQHIRRQKATSNICTAQVLLAVTAAMYGVWHGPEGLTEIARRVHAGARRVAAAARDAGFSVSDAPFFDTVRVETGDQTDAVLARAAAKQINLRRLDDATLTIALDETVTEADLADLAAVLGGSLPADAGEDIITGDHVRTSAFMTHPFFHLYRSETEMMRHLHRLESRDLALNTAMIPLGSCTMKLNAATEMIPITWRGFGGLHPFVPVEQAQGYRALFDNLEAWLSEVTGFDAISLQPNAGSQGEYAGLLAIRGYHLDRGDTHRDVCLIPTSAHGTNPASAVMAGMKVIAVKCDDQGNIDVEDLRAKASKHRDSLSALMVTYPSTHGVFEESIREICGIVHDNGGQVYMDGANMNAMVGLCRPGDFGADVCHLNLHKTFCLAEGTPVTLADGTQIRIEDLALGQHVKAWSDEEGGVRGAPLEGTYRTGRKQCVEITLQDGRTITCTPDHRVRTTQGWVQAGDLTEAHRVLVGLEGALHAAHLDPVAAARGFQAQYADLTLSMADRMERARTLAFFRLLGMTLSDGTICRETQSQRLHVRLFFGARQDARTALDDIALLTGKHPTISDTGVVFGVRLPANLARAIAAVPGVTIGKRTRSAETLPHVIKDFYTPAAIRREFFGALFGGDGCAPLVVHLQQNPNTMKEVRFIQHRSTAAAADALMSDIKAGLAWLGVDSTLTPATRTEDVGDEPRWRGQLTITWGTAFSENIGFRYCTHKSARLAVATAWWRLKETIKEQRAAVADDAMALKDTASERIPGWKHWVQQAVALREDLHPILNSYYAGFQGNKVLNRSHLQAAIQGQKGLRKDIRHLRRTHHRATFPAHNRRGEPTGVPDLNTFLSEIGVQDWFNDHTPAGETYTVTYATPREAVLEPTFHLGVVGVRPVGMRTVYDITVTELHSFLANGVVVHNCIPHGGGGPGMGPIGVKAHLAPFLPGNPLGRGEAVGPVSAANWGSPSILPISWSYIAMTGADGLRAASEIAVLSANYIAHRLGEHFPVLYTGPHGRVAHECILDLRHLKDAANITVDDVAKRLMDYGFHAPTMSWPVTGTLMVEPTESESLAELDRFCDAMISIRDEIRAIEEGRADREDNVLRNAPHTAESVCSDSWDHAYSRMDAAFPKKGGLAQKFWPAVRRVDNVYGDRNLACSCQAWMPAEDLETSAE